MSKRLDELKDLVRDIKVRTCRTPYRLYCLRIDNARNMARYYTLSIQPTLFGEVRYWGRIGTRGGEKPKYLPQSGRPHRTSWNSRAKSAKKAIDRLEIVERPRNRFRTRHAQGDSTQFR